MTKLSFNAKSIDTSKNDFQPIPAGRYNVMITDSEIKETNAGNGHYLKLTFKVLDGEYVNKLIWLNLNYDNPNDTAVKIAQHELASICMAVNVPEFEDSTELHNIPLSGIVKIKKGTQGYNDTNTITGFKAPSDDNGQNSLWG